MLYLCGFVMKMKIPYKISTKCLETECDCQKYLLCYYKSNNSSEVLNKDLELVK